MPATWHKVLSIQCFKWIKKCLNSLELYWYLQLSGIMGKLRPVHLLSNFLFLSSCKDYIIPLPHHLPYDSLCTSVGSWSNAVLYLVKPNVILSCHWSPQWRVRLHKTFLFGLMARFRKFLQQSTKMCSNKIAD